MAAATGGEVGEQPADWLVAIDLQHVFADASSEWRAPRFASVLDPVSALIARYRPRVVLTRFVAPARPDGAWVDYYRRFPWALQPSRSQLWDLVDGLEGEVLTTTTFGKWGPALQALVGPASRLVLAGVSTDCCVLSTALAAADAGVAVRVVREACAGADDAAHERALEAMAMYAPLVEVVSLDDALRDQPGG